MYSQPLVTIVTLNQHMCLNIRACVYMYVYIYIIELDMGAAGKFAQEIDADAVFRRESHARSITCGTFAFAIRHRAIRTHRTTFLTHLWQEVCPGS